MHRDLMIPHCNQELRRTWHLGQQEFRGVSLLDIEIVAIILIANDYYRLCYHASLYIYISICVLRSF